MLGRAFNYLTGIYKTFQAKASEEKQEKAANDEENLFYFDESEGSTAAKQLHEEAVENESKMITQERVDEALVPLTSAVADASFPSQMLLAPLTEKDLLQHFPPTSKRPFLALQKEKLHSRARQIFKSSTFSNFIPILKLKNIYSWKKFITDTICGLSIGVMAIPMGMSYAILAGMGTEYGLYNGLVFPLVYMLFGTSQYCAVGVSAIEALITADAVNQLLLVDAVAATRTQVTIALTCCTAIVMLCMHIFGLSILATFLADPVLSGFSTASVFIINTSQLGHALQISVPSSLQNSSFETPRTLWYYLVHISEANIASILFTTIGILLLYLVKKASQRWCKKYPLPHTLFLFVLGTLFSWLLKADVRWNLKIVREITQGLPSFLFPNFTVPVSDLIPSIYTRHDAAEAAGMYNLFWPLLLRAVPIAIMFFMVHITIVKTLDQQNMKLVLNTSQELFALSLVNLVGGMLQCFPNATSVSRSSVLSSIGAESTLHNLPAALLMFLTLLYITPVLYYVPHSILASVVLFGSFGMLDFSGGVKTIRLGNLDCFLWIVSFTVTFTMGAIAGILTSIALSLLWLIKNASRPSTCLLGQLPNTNLYRNIKRFPLAKEIPGIKIFRFDASVNFSNSSFFFNKIKNLPLENCRIFIVEGSSINCLDITAVSMFQRLDSLLKAKDIVLLFANWKGNMRDFLERANFHSTVPLNRCFLSLHDAVCWSKSFLAEEANKYSLLPTDPDSSNKLILRLNCKNEEATEALKSLNNSAKEKAKTPQKTNAFNTRNERVQSESLEKKPSFCNNCGKEGNIYSEIEVCENILENRSIPFGRNDEPFENHVCDARIFLWDGLSCTSPRFHYVKEVNGRGKELLWGTMKMR